MTKAEFIEETAMRLFAANTLDPKRSWEEAVALANARPAELGQWAATSAPAASGGGSRSGKKASGPLPTTLPNYGKAKGQPIADASDSDLEYYARNAERSLDDSSKRRFHASEQAMLDAIRAEQARRADGHDDPPGHPIGPGPTDDDIPF